MSTRPNLANVFATTALLVALGGAAFAASGFVGRDGRIHGCVTAKGKLTLAKPGKKCAKGRAIAWRKSGRRGRTGPSGRLDVVVRQGTLTLHYTCTPVIGNWFCNSFDTTGTVPCAVGERATDGGYGLPPDGQHPKVSKSEASPTNGTPSGWSVEASNTTSSSTNTFPDTLVPIYAVCVAP